MTTDAEWYKNKLQEMGITQVKAAKLLGIDARTSRRYALGECPVPPTVKLLLDIIASGKKPSGRPVRAKQ